MVLVKAFYMSLWRFISLIYLIHFFIWEIIWLKCSRHIHMSIMFLQNYNLLCSVFIADIHIYAHRHALRYKKHIVKADWIFIFFVSMAMFLILHVLQASSEQNFQVTSKGFLYSDQLCGACRKMRNELTSEVQWKVKSEHRHSSWARQHAKLLHLGIGILWVQEGKAGNI